jgi:hypothetical protein
MNFFTSMLSEDGNANSVSTIRVATLLVLLFVLVPRAVIGIRTGIIPELTTQELGLISVALAAKVIQRGKETDGTPTATAPVPAPAPAAVKMG